MDADNPKILTEAASNGKIDVLKQLLEDTTQEETIQDLLNTAAWKSQISTVVFLLSKYPSVLLLEETIRAAIYSSSIDLFSTLLSKDSTIINHQFDRRGTPIALACMSKQPVEFLEFLLKAGADPNQDPDTAPLPLVSVAAFYHDSRAAELLLKHGAKLEDSGALEMAMRRGNEVMVHFLTDYGMKSGEVEA
ncbi:hypothetical protein EYC80_009251 [Monilinia laxa]|uniref:Ankyrin repeat-containing protein n=1 Tax=Monilinia laxa TaxID=61186 RepID=A0A5N6JX99_MONLA|nr:hypothetical protein EYC80_009251 [Monilinia laxa]